MLRAEHGGVRGEHGCGEERDGTQRCQQYYLQPFTIIL